MVWRSLLEPTTGPLTQFMLEVGLSPQQWLLEPRGVFHLISGGRVGIGVGPSLSLCCIMVFEVWRSTGFMIVVFLAALTQRDRHLEEAAELDGATKGQVIRHIVLPILSPAIFFLMIVSVIQSFQSFSGFYALTGDGRGPVDTTQNLIVYIYTNLYENEKFGYGSAVATMLSIAIMVFTFVQWRVMRRGVHYAS
jgi:multiple sugar transport system permease protein